MPSIESDEEFSQLIEKLNHSEKAIVVEGNKDKAALRALGIKNKIFTINKPLFAVAEEIAESNKDIVILTDLDKKGKELYGKLSTLLQRLGVRIDSQYREFLFRILILKSEEKQKKPNPSNMETCSFQKVLRADFPALKGNWRVSMVRFI